jgi:hypothetical protein
MSDWEEMYKALLDSYTRRVTEYHVACKERDELRGKVELIRAEAKAWKNRNDIMALCAIKAGAERNRAEAERDEARYHCRALAEWLTSVELGFDYGGLAEELPWLQVASDTQQIEQK